MLCERHNRSLQPKPQLLHRPLRLLPLRHPHRHQRRLDQSHPQPTQSPLLDLHLPSSRLPPRIRVNCCQRSPAVEVDHRDLKPLHGRLARPHLSKTASPVIRAARSDRLHLRPPSTRRWQGQRFRQTLADPTHHPPGLGSQGNHLQLPAGLPRRRRPRMPPALRLRPPVHRRQLAHRPDHQMGPLRHLRGQQANQATKRTLYPPRRPRSE